MSIYIDARITWLLTQVLTDIFRHRLFFCVQQLYINLIITRLPTSLNESKGIVMKKITILLPIINIIGAVFTYFYFSLILKTRVLQENIPAYYSPLFFVIGTAFLVFIFNVSRRKKMKSLFDVAYGQVEIHSLEDSEIFHLQREALQFPIVVTSITFVVWILAGFIFGFIQPLITGKVFNTETPNLIDCLRNFFGISILGGGVTTLILYFVLENVWRKFIPNFFP